jgi:hypothetical protein
MAQFNFFKNTNYLCTIQLYDLHRYDDKTYVRDSERHNNADRTDDVHRTLDRTNTPTLRHAEKQVSLARGERPLPLRHVLNSSYPGAALARPSHVIFKRFEECPGSSSSLSALGGVFSPGNVAPLIAVPFTTRSWNGAYPA